MERIGVRELRQRASEMLRRVAAGESLEVTDRGRPVAVLSPVPHGSPLQQLRAAGEVSEASGELPEPLVIEGPAPSRTLAQLRAEER